MAKRAAKKQGKSYHCGRCNEVVATVNSQTKKNRGIKASPGCSLSLLPNMAPKIVCKCGFFTILLQAGV
jgi:hypothetical protein